MKWMLKPPTIIILLYWVCTVYDNRCETCQESGVGSGNFSSFYVVS